MIIEKREKNYNIQIFVAHSILWHCKILCKIILYRRNNGLYEFQEDYQIHMDTEHFATFFDRLYNLFHNIGMSEMKLNG